MALSDEVVEALGDGNIHEALRLIDAASDGGIVAGASAEGDTPGDCVAAIEVFDKEGASIGFIAVYDEITVTP